MFRKYVPDTSQELSLSLDSMKGCQDWLDNEIISIDAFFSMISMYQEPNKYVFSRVANYACFYMRRDYAFRCAGYLATVTSALFATDTHVLSVHFCSRQGYQ